MNKKYQCIEDYNINYNFFGWHYYGTVKKGTIFELIREPIPKKKKYKLQEIKQNNINYEPIIIYLRKSELKRYFKEI